MLQPCSNILNFFQYTKPIRVGLREYESSKKFGYPLNTKNLTYDIHVPGGFDFSRFLSLGFFASVLVVLRVTIIPDLFC